MILFDPMAILEIAHMFILGSLNATFLYFWLIASKLNIIDSIIFFIDELNKDTYPLMLKVMFINLIFSYFYKKECNKEITSIEAQILCFISISITIAEILIGLQMIVNLLSYLEIIPPLTLIKGS